MLYITVKTERTYYDTEIAAYPPALQLASLGPALAVVYDDATETHTTYDLRGIDLDPLEALLDHLHSVPAIAGWGIWSLDMPALYLRYYGVFDSNDRWRADDAPMVIDLAETIAAGAAHATGGERCRHTANGVMRSNGIVWPGITSVDYSIWLSRGGADDYQRAIACACQELIGCAALFHTARHDGIWLPASLDGRYERGFQLWMTEHGTVARCEVL